MINLLLLTKDVKLLLIIMIYLLIKNQKLLKIKNITITIKLILLNKEYKEKHQIEWKENHNKILLIYNSLILIYIN